MYVVGELEAILGKKRPYSNGHEEFGLTLVFTRQLSYEVCDHLSGSSLHLFHIKTRQKCPRGPVPPVRPSLRPDFKGGSRLLSLQLPCVQ